MQNAEIRNRNSDLVRTKLNPVRLWRHFADICGMEHGSGNEFLLLTHIEQIATRSECVSVRDENNNFLVYVPASKGLEDRQVVCLQAHLDMVCEKRKEVQNIFPIELVLGEDGKLRANGSTLGADNGIGVAAMIAVMTSEEIKHGPLELLFTSKEEIGLLGAKGFDYSLLRSKKIINLDCEDDSLFWVGCAGGSVMHGTFRPELIHHQVNKDTIQFAGDKNGEDFSKYLIKISNFSGGHSGIDINLGRGNAIKILARILAEFTEFGLKIVDFSGGNAMNSIPREAESVFVIPTFYASGFKEVFDSLVSIICKEYPSESPKIELVECEIPSKIIYWNTHSTIKFLDCIIALPDGPLKMEPKNPSLVCTSVNLGICKTNDGEAVTIICSYRSSMKSQLDYTEQILTSVFQLSGMICMPIEGYLPWTPQFDTSLLKTATFVYETLFDNKPKLETVHAGLECAVFYKEISGAQIISCGPTMGDVHTPDEWVSVESVQKFWKFLTNFLEELAK